MRIQSILLVLVGLVLANDCYESQKVWLVIRSGGRARIFETKADWLKSGNGLEQLYGEDLRWFARNKSGVLPDWELMRIVGFEQLGQELHSRFERSRRTSTIQLIIGVPLGLVMLGGSAYWGYETWQKQTPSTIDMAGSIVLGFGGLGVFLSSISNYRKYHRPPEITQHFISVRQAVDVVDRYNTSLLHRCGAISED